MKRSPDNPDERLEQFVHETLRALPLRAAPGSLEQRVQAEIARRIALPWWRKSFAHWPVPARAFFLLLGVGTVKVALMVSVWVMAGFDSTQFRDAFATQLTWMENGVAVVQAVTGCFQIIGRHIPSIWFYGSVAFIGGLYAAFFGVGAVAYKAIRAVR